MRSGYNLGMTKRALWTMELVGACVMAVLALLLAVFG